MDHLLTTTWSRGGAEPLTKTVTITDGGENNLDVTVAASATNLNALWAIDVSALKSLYILSDKDITIKTNSSTEPDDTLTIKANVPFDWHTTKGFTNPLTVDVVSIYVTRTGAGAGTGSGTLKIRALQDSTP